ncbi:MAG: cation-translocating P-type ATPase [Candidatus Nanopelagicales bacterium]
MEALAGEPRPVGARPQRSGGPIGLTQLLAAQRLAEDGPNELPTAKPRNLLQQAWAVLREPMLLFLLGAGIVNFLLSELLDGIILMLSAVLVIAISIYQERKTENALVALRDLSSPRALVIRDGERVRIPGRDVVREDLVLLAEGDRVPADAALVEGVNLAVDESALTGESVPVRKSTAGQDVTGVAMGRPGGDGTPWLFSGTLVVKGHGTAVVRATGAGTELGRIGTALRGLEEERTRLQREIDRIVVVVAGAGLIAAVAVVVVYGLTRGVWLEGVLAGIATAMSMLPEEFPVVLTVFLTLGAWRMSRKRVLTRRSPVIETLGSATVICVDKTGTLTLNSMTVRELIVDGAVHAVGEGPLPERFRPIVEHGALASPIEPFDPMDKAFTELGRAHLAGTGHLHRGWSLEREYPLSDSLLALSHVWRDPDGGDRIVAAKGAPEAIAELCRLSPEQRAELTEQVEDATASGRRVLGVARARFSANGDLPDDQRDFAFEFLGLASLQDPVRPGVPEAVAECARAGVRIVMITGDYPGTAMAIAREVGLDHEAGFMTGADLEAMGEEELAARVRTVSVFARMVPEQKLQLIRALRANGEVVGMTGDGVNDAPALRAADIGIAMGARGTDVARESADLVITDDDFTSIAGGVRQGRGIFDNLRKAMAYIVAVHVVIFGMSLIPVLGPTWPLVLLPVQIAFLELIIDPACSIVFEAEEVDPRIMEQSPRGLGEPILTRRVLALSAIQGVTVLAAVISVFLWAELGGRPDDEVRSVAFAALVIGNLALILVNRSWRLSIWQTAGERQNRTVKWILGGAGTLLVLVITVPWLRHAFNFGPLQPADWIIVLVAGFAGVMWFEVYKRVAHPKGV